MKNTIKVGIILLILIGFTVTGCPEPDSSNKTTPKHTHKWGEWEVTTAATCVTKGLKTRICEQNATHIETQDTCSLLIVLVLSVNEVRNGNGCIIG